MPKFFHSMSPGRCWPAPVRGWRCRIPDGMFQALDVVAVVHAVEVDVERLHAAFDVQVLDDQLVAVFPRTSGASRCSSASTSSSKRLSGTSRWKFQRIGHAPDAVDLLDHHELALDRRLVHSF